MNTQKTIKVRSGIKAGGLFERNHTRGLKVRAGLKAGGLFERNHSLKVRTAIRGGQYIYSKNHNRSAL